MLTVKETEIIKAVVEEERIFLKDRVKYDPDLLISYDKTLADVLEKMEKK